MKKLERNNRSHEKKINVVLSFGGSGHNPHVTSGVTLDFHVIFWG